MPREYIYTNSVNPDGTAPQLLVSVGWQKQENGGYMQLATIQNGMEHTVDEGGFYCDLDRQAINDLIKLLRKARDQAYGKDE